MDESQDSAAFTAECVTVDPRRAEHVQQVLSAARATLARSRGEQFRDAEPLGVVPEWRSRERPLSSRDRTQPPAPAAQPDTSVSTWEQERDAVFEAIVGLREWCETLSEQLAELRWRQLGTSFDNPNVAYHALNRWEHEERARIEAARGSCDDQEQEPLELPPLRSLRP